MTETTKLMSVPLTAGADPEIGDHNGLTPLHITVMEDDVELAKVTITHYFLILHPGASTPFGITTPLMFTHEKEN